MRPRVPLPAATALLAALVAPLHATPARAQDARGTVVGQVAILERAGARTRDLENAVLWLEPAPGEAPATPAAGVPAMAAVEIVMDARRFRPAVRVVTPGSVVRFPNYDPFRHNVFSNTGPSRFDLGLYPRGESREARFAAAGVHPIFCNIHARMVAFVVAVPTTWHAQAGADGTFEIPAVPPGRYRLHAWHDRGGAATTDVEVPAVGRARADVRLDARGWRFVAHRNKHGADYPPETRDRY